MDSLKIKGHTRIIGEIQGYLGLPLRDAHYMADMNQFRDLLISKVVGDPLDLTNGLKRTIVQWVIDQFKKVAVVLPPIRDMEVNDPVTGPGTPVMESIWKPSAEDIALIMAGRPIKLLVVGSVHPPVMVSVADPEDVE